MRYYFLSQEGEEFSVDLTSVKNDNSHVFKFCFYANEKTCHYYFKKVANKFFISQDLIRWKKINRAIKNHTCLVKSQQMSVYRGYKPSSLSDQGEGAFVTKMPGKVIKIFVKENETIKKGQALLILEAMKMENEIKSDRDGIIKSVNVKEGQALEQGISMLEVE